MATDIVASAAALAAQLQPPRVRPFSGGATPLARATVGQAPDVVAVAAPVDAKAPAAPLRPWQLHPMSQPLATDTRVIKSISPLGGRIVVHVRPGKTNLRAAVAAIGADALANGIDGHPVRLFQSAGKGPVMLASSDPKDAERVTASPTLTAEVARAAKSPPVKGTVSASPAVG